MYQIGDLFEKRDVFAAKLETIMQEEGYTKASLCKEVGISRPTLDRLLAAEITNKASFEKHVEKICTCLKITPDNILGNIVNKANRIRRLKKMLQLSDEKLSKAIGISIERLKEIEAGGEATLAELRDIAACCETSLRGVLGNYYFVPPVSTMAYWAKDDDMSGFWGHIGILLSNQKKYKWYPITLSVYKEVSRTRNHDYLVVPCMNNVLLFLNMSEVDDIVLLDEACDQPSFANWDPSVSEGEIPLVVYDALPEFMMSFQDGDDEENNEMSAKFKKLLAGIIEEKNWDEDKIYEITEQTNIYFKRGNCLKVDIDFERYQELTDVITETYEFGDMELDTKRPIITTKDGEKLFINIENVAMMEMPLVAVENEICRGLEEMFEEE